MRRVVVGLSGGVDSSVAAYLLKEQGYDVIGMFMRNWHDESVIIDDECPWIEDSNDAMLVADKLGIPYQVIDLSKEYKERIVDYMFSEYENGRTPNPDVLCNREIKFDVFLKAAMQLGADYVATGHYCQKETITKDGETLHRLIFGADPNKDQSYFLCQVTQEQLAKVLFPIGHLQKSEVREIAKRENLVTAEKKDSQGLCFVGKVRLPDFLQQQLKSKKGNIIEIDAGHKMYQKAENPMIFNSFVKPFEYEPEFGERIAEHIGAHFFTIGQRRGLAVGGTAEPLFVIGTDVEKNLLYVGQSSDHPGLWRRGLFVRAKDVHWVRPDLTLKAGDETSYQIRIRYRQPLSGAKLIMEEEGLYVIFDDKLSAVTPGQFVAWYRDGELIGSGTIS